MSGAECLALLPVMGLCCESWILCLLCTPSMHHMRKTDLPRPSLVLPHPPPQEVRDEYGGSMPVMLYALRPQAAAAAVAGAGEDGDPAGQRRRCLNEGLSLTQLAPRCSTYSVLAPAAATAALPLLRWQPGNAYHASALCAAALDTATLPYRLAGGEGHGTAIGELSLGVGTDGELFRCCCYCCCCCCCAAMSAYHPAMYQPAVQGWFLSPIRAHPAASSCSNCAGRSDIWGLTHLLTSQHRSPLTALSMSMPCPSLPADMQQQAATADARLQHGARDGAAGTASGPPSSSGSSSGGPFTTRWLASLTPGVAAASDTGRFAESVVLRGPRTGSAPLDLCAAAVALDAALAEERLRCVRQRTLVGQPLAVPLPFPHIWARDLSRDGDAPVGRPSSSSGGGQDIASCAVLTRLGGTSAFGPVVAAAQRRFRTTARSAQGQATLEGWGHGSEELGEMEEELERLAHAYDEEDA